MKKYTIRDWLDGKIRVEVRTEKEFMKLMDIAEKNGIRWRNGKKATDTSCLAPIVISCNEDFPGMVWGFCDRYDKHSVPLVDILPDICRRELHITSAGNVTHAVLKENGKVTKRTMAVYNPDDKYDFLTGARAALDRMQGKNPLSLEDVPTEKLVEELAMRKGIGTVYDGDDMMIMTIKKEMIK